MSPRFEPDMSKVRASFPIYERGEYEVAITEASPFAYTRENDDGSVDEIAGIQYNFEMVGRIQTNGDLDREEEGEPVSSHRIYLHSEGAWGFAKQFIMAAAGFDPQEEEDQFNEEWVSTHDWHFDGHDDEFDVGSAYTDIVGNHFECTLDVEIDDEDRKRQQMRAFRPVS